ncbi:MAG: hypothetical protein CVU09_07435 [Bacteroidetes bacterium HGW-Bacteroidetes-4]|jgi:hypothetical protein|nr:MAG: hypothetical protein CVU09_07435 [Bacteroidetes bacterium HGW-Bacteroidetes-4]
MREYGTQIIKHSKMLLLEMTDVSKVRDPEEEVEEGMIITIRIIGAWKCGEPKTDLNRYRKVRIII